MEVNQSNNRSENDQPIFNPIDKPILDQGSVVGHPKQSLKNIPKTKNIPSPDWKKLHTLWQRHMENENGNDIVSTFDFPIGNILRLEPMKSIPLSALPNFNGQISEDPNTFLFEFIF
jgi:hypothetical protein